jgi:ethanolamine ammonia-lyase small subunit
MMILLTMPMYTSDPWTNLRRYTAARIALGRAGVSLPTSEHLTFQMHHARAIDAVYAEMDIDRLRAELVADGVASIVLDTQAGNRERYLQRPDYGRRLSPASRDELQHANAGSNNADVVIAIVDGLSAMAVNRHAVPVVAALKQRLAKSGHTLGAVPIVQRGRVALQDEIGAIMGARVVVSLIGERPGLGSPDSLGAYLVFGPRAGNTDANRNCVSNIRPEGLGYEAAADAIYWLIAESIRRKISGVPLKDDRQLIAPTRALRE